MDQVEKEIEEMCAKAPVTEPTAPAGPRRFSIVRKEEPFIMADAAGVDAHYVLREFDGPARNAYMESMSKRVRLGPDGKPAGITDHAGLYAAILGRSVYIGTLQPDGKTVRATDTLVAPAVSASWPSSVQEELVKLALELSGLAKESDEAAKKN